MVQGVSGIKAAASGMIAQQLNIDVIANNLANINTPGFKELIPVFKTIGEVVLKDYSADKNLNKASQGTRGSYSAGTGIDATILDLKQGHLVKTDNKLDFALQGEGFFSVMTEQGEFYTRNGNFKLNDDGILVTQDGNTVLGDGGTIKIDAGADKKALNNIHVSDDGTMYLDKTELGKLKIVSFENMGGLVPVGNSLYKAEGQNPSGSENTKVNQGFIESSNSNAVDSMIKTITATRTYETLAKILKTSESTLERAVNDVGRVRE